MSAINSSRSLLQISGSPAVLAGGGTTDTAVAELSGTLTEYQSDCDVGDVVTEDGAGDFLIITAIASETAMTVHQAPSNAMSGATLHKYAFSAVQAAFDATGPAPEAEELDVTSWDTIGFREKIAGLIDSGTFEATIFFQPLLTQHAAMVADFYATTRRAWKLWYNDSLSAVAPPSPTNSRWTFVGDIGSFSTSASQGSAIEASLSVFITGQAIITAGA